MRCLFLACVWEIEKNKQNNPIKTEIDKLNIKKEKIISSENITNSQKKIMIEKIDEEIIKLSKEE